MKKLHLTTVLLALSVIAFSQNLRPIYEQTPINLLQSKVLASYTKNTFLENLVKGNDDNLYITNFPEGLVLKISPTGAKEIYAKIPGKIAG